MNRLLLIAATLAAGALFAGGNASAARATAKPPISFLASQADTGRLTYYAKCAMCHGANLEGISGPALKGNDANLQSLTVSYVYKYTIVQMPVGNAGGLSSKEYVNLVAFLLRSNGRHAGTTALTPATLSKDNSKIGGSDSKPT